MKPDVIIRKNRAGYYCVAVPLPNGVNSRLVSTGERDLARATAVIQENGTDRLILLARARVLSADAIAIATTGNRKTCREIVDLWYDEVRLDVAESTADNYLRQVNQLMVDRWDKPLTSVTREELDEFVNASHLKYSSRGLRLAAVCSFWEYASNYGLIIGNLARTIRVRHQDLEHHRIEPKQIFPFTPAEYALIAQPGSMPEHWRMIAIISYWTGMRMIDCFRLNRASISETHITVWTVKRKHRIELPLSHPLIGHPDLLAVLDVLRARTKTKNDPCFEQGATYKNELASTTFIRHITRLGISFKSFHCLRHTFALRLKAAGVTIEDIAKFMAHNSTETTQIYLRGKNPNEN